MSGIIIILTEYIYISKSESVKEEGRSYEAINADLNTAQEQAKLQGGVCKPNFWFFPITERKSLQSVHLYPPSSLKILPLPCRQH